MKSFLLIAAIGFSFTGHAQMKEGRIVFERKVQMQIRSMNLDPAIATQIPPSRTDNFELMFSGKKTLWQYLPSATNDNEINASSGGMVVQMRMGGTNEVLYQDLETGLRTAQRSVIDRNFIVTDSVKKLDWKLTNETKTILDHKVYKAISQRIGSRNVMSMENGEMKRQQIPDTSSVVAWFTPDIPVSGGPSDYQGQLPGMILELDMNNGQNVTRAIEISAKVNADKIKEPKGGKKLTAAAFKVESDKLMEQMRKNMPGGMQIRTDH